MAKHSLSSMTGLILLLVLFFVVRSSTAVSGLGGMVGGRMKVKDVKTNEEVQQLGSYSVEQYNRLQQKGNNNGYGGDLRFQEVVEAERQVVSGIKYYLKITAAAAATSGGGGAPKTFNAVVVVKPWDHSKELLKFRPHDQPLLIREINARVLE